MNNELVEFLQQNGGWVNLHALQKRFGGSKIYVPKIKQGSKTIIKIYNSIDEPNQNKRLEKAHKELLKQGFDVSKTTIWRIINGKKRDS